MRERAEVWGFFYNPNIHPRDEFNKRLNAVKKLSNLMGLNVIYDEEYKPREFIKGVKSSGSGSRAFGERCVYCYESRLEAVAKKASEQGFDAFTSSLLYSKYQDHDGIKKAGREFAKKYDVEFFYEDFRGGWIEGIEKSREMELYRQKYCGCIYSKIEREEEKRAKKEAKRLKREKLLLSS